MLSKGVGLKNIDMAFQDSEAFEAAQAAFDKAGCDALVPVGWKNHQVLQVTATPIVPGHDASDECIGRHRDKTQPRVTQQVSFR